MWQILGWATAVAVTSATVLAAMGASIEASAAADLLPMASSQPAQADPATTASCVLGDATVGDEADRGKVTINGKIFDVEVVDEPRERRKGLSNRRSLPYDQGMLFLYKTPGYPGFWMKDMRFGIDIVYIHAKQVVTVVKNVPPPTAPTENLVLYHPDAPADKVLEINASLATKYNFRKGDTVKIE